MVYNTHGKGLYVAINEVELKKQVWKLRWHLQWMCGVVIHTRYARK